MVAKKSRKNNKTLLILLVALLMLGVLGFFGIQKYLLWQKLQFPISCNDPKTITNYIKTAWGNPKTLHDRTKEYSNVQGLYLLPNYNTPHLDFRGKNTAVYEFPVPVGTLNSFVKEKVLPKIEQSGYKYDSLSSERGETFGQIIETVSGVYQNGKSLLEIDYGNSTNIDGQQVPTLSVTCGEKSQALVDRYKELLALPAIQKEIDKELPYAKKISNLRFEIHIDTGSYIYAGIGNWNGGGSGIWLGKDNGSWKIIATGQQAPDCKLLEQYHAPAGEFCTDYANNKLTQTK